MKRKLLFAMSLFGIAAFAQETHHVSWCIGANTAQFSKTIAPGDTVMWMWTTGHPHTVTSQAGSAESFNSGTLQGVGLSYSKTFTVVGANPYVCIFHGGMAGVITVSSTAGTHKNLIKTFSVWPNPATDLINVTAETPIDRIELFDVEGRKVMDSANAGNSSAKIYTEGLTAGTYLLRVTCGGLSKNVSILKK